MTAQPWRNRIVGEGEESPDQLLANPANWRVHPKQQQDALAGVLDEVGWVQQVIVNRTTGHLVDGHLRVSLALRRNEPTIPVLYVDLDPAEEALVLATLDPLSALATTDAAKLDELLRDVSTGEAAVQQLLADLAAEAGLFPDAAAPLADPGAQVDRAEELRERWGVERGSLWQIGRHRLLCGDSTNADDVARLMDGATCETLVFDPPWDAGLPLPDGDWQSILAFTDGRRAGDTIRQCGAPAWVFVWDCVSSWYTPNRPLARMKLCLWYGDVTAFDPDGAHYGDAGEAREVWNSRGAYTYRPDPRGKHLADLYSEPITRLHDDGPSHAKPLDWLRLLLADCTAGAVFEPFAGSGTTVAAAESLARPVYGLDIDPCMVAVTLERMAGLGVVGERVD